MKNGFCWEQDGGENTRVEQESHVTGPGKEDNGNRRDINKSIDSEDIWKAEPIDFTDILDETKAHWLRALAAETIRRNGL